MSKKSDTVVIAGTIEADATGHDPDLSGCMAKLARAQEHLEVLDDELWKFFNSDPYRAVGKGEGEHGWYVFRVKVLRQPGPRIGVLIGEYVHQVRSAYDHFAWALASLRYGKGKPPSSLGFPIETSRRNFEKKAKHRLRGHIPDDWFALIEAIQPYGAHNDSLAILEGLWNRDKHQLVIPLPVTETMQLGHSEYRAHPDAGSILERRARTGVRLEEGAELGRVKIAPTGPNPRVDMYVLATAKIQSQGGIGFFWDLLPAEGPLRLMLSAFPLGEAAFEVYHSPGLLNRVYKTAITTLKDEADATREGFYVPDSSWRDRFP